MRRPSRFGIELSGRGRGNDLTDVFSEKRAVIRVTDLTRFDLGA